MKNRKRNFGFSYTQIWQILKHFTVTFHQAQTCFLWWWCPISPYNFFFRFRLYRMICSPLVSFHDFDASIVWFLHWERKKSNILLVVYLFCSLVNSFLTIFIRILNVTTSYCLHYISSFFRVFFPCTKPIILHQKIEMLIDPLEQLN